MPPAPLIPVGEMTQGGLPLLSLSSRLGLLRQRRRHNLLRQVLGVIWPVLVGITILLLLAGFGVLASVR